MEDKVLEQMSVNPLDVQIGGEHYKHCGMQPIELTEGVRMYPSCSSIVRYIFRHKQKNGREDLGKALQYVNFIEKYDNWYEGYQVVRDEYMTTFADIEKTNELFYDFIRLNPQLGENQVRVILAIQHKDIDALKRYVLKEIEQNYPKDSCKE